MVARLNRTKVPSPPPAGPASLGGVKLDTTFWSKVGEGLPAALSEAKPRTKRIVYWVLFGGESAGMLYILWITLPLYRKLVSGPGGYRPGAPLILPVLTVSLAMQLSYWSKREMRPPVRSGHNRVGGHLLLFLSRLSFIFAGANLSLLLFRRAADTVLSPMGVLVLFFSSFAQFCYVRELEALARIVEGGSTGERARTMSG
jgi:hypothetical protein